MECPECGRFNSMTALRCDCGYEFPSAPTAAERRRKIPLKVRDKSELARVLSEVGAEGEAIPDVGRKKKRKAHLEVAATARPSVSSATASKATRPGMRRWTWGVAVVMTIAALYEYDRANKQEQRAFAAEDRMDEALDRLRICKDSVAECEESLGECMERRGR